MSKIEPSSFVTLVIFVPETHADLIRQVMGDAGAGKIGNYSHGSFSVKGQGRFLPLEGAKPFLGRQGDIETVIEERIETVCEISILKKVLEKIREVHPYEEPAIEFYPLYKVN